MNIIFLHLLGLISTGNYNDMVESVEIYSSYDILYLYHSLIKNEDSKSFIDRPTRKPLEMVKKEFKELKKEFKLEDKTAEEIVSIILSNELMKGEFLSKFEQFISDNYAEVGSDLVLVKPPDFKESNGINDKIKDESNKELYAAINNKWPDMSLFYKEIGENETTSLQNKHPFFIPGGRFREMYYWDSYWIFRGLLINHMEESAVNMVNNFLTMIEKHGYMPNGSRSYYRNRSQPPFFPSMLYDLYVYNKEKYGSLVLGLGLTAAVKEHKWFVNNRIKKFNKDGKVYSMFQYNVTSNFPRPESFKEDLETARERGVDYTETYSNLKTAAESGWDFSTRWLLDESELSTICIRDVIPVDLNALIYLNEKIISFLFKEARNKINGDYYEEMAAKRAEDINEVLWNSEQGVWNDYHFKKTNENKIEQKDFYSDQRFFFSNIMPMIYGVKPPLGISPLSILNTYKNELFGYPGGIPASGKGKVHSKQQWDFPNAWAVHQSMFFKYLISIGEKDLAYHCARSFFDNVKLGFKNKNLFFEKYNCEELGNIGTGGEYVTQTGFGWTNGTILEIFDSFSDRLDYEFNFEKSRDEIFKYLEKFGYSKPVDMINNNNVPQALLNSDIKYETK